jgi:hypothetical protein
VLTGKPLFPGRNVVHQLELITDLLGTPSPEIIAKVCLWTCTLMCVWGEEGAHVQSQSPPNLTTRLTVYPKPPRPNLLDPAKPGETPPARAPPPFPSPDP